MEISIDKERRLFVIPCGSGYSCMGFEYVAKQLQTLSQALLKFGINIGEIIQEQIGTLNQYEQYRRAIGLIGNHNLGTWFDPDTPKKVRAILERYRKSDEKIRIFYGNGETGLDWMEEFDVVGRVGRSGGVTKVPLLIEDGECGGPAMLDQCIVRLIDAASRKELYRHPSYHQGLMEIRPAECGAPYSHGVWVSGENNANFRSYGEAAQWVAFMSGHCMEAPQ